MHSVWPLSCWIEPKLLLLGPFERQFGQPLQALNGEICGLVPGEDRLDDVGAETGERQKAADLCWIDAIIACQGFERNDLRPSTAASICMIE